MPHVRIQKRIFLESILEFKRFQYKNVDTQQIKVLNKLKIEGTRK